MEPNEQNNSQNDPVLDGLRAAVVHLYVAHYLGDPTAWDDAVAVGAILARRLVARGASRA